MDKSNYYSSTIAIFKGCKRPRRDPDYISNSGSLYWYGSNSKGEYVIRHSNHWVEKREINCSKNTGDWVVSQCHNIGGCLWALKTTNPDAEEATGKCYFKDFHPRFNEDTI